MKYAFYVGRFLGTITLAYLFRVPETKKKALTLGDWYRLTPSKYQFFSLSALAATRTNCGPATARTCMVRWKTDQQFLWIKTNSSFFFSGSLFADFETLQIQIHDQGRISQEACVRFTMTNSVTIVQFCRMLLRTFWIILMIKLQTSVYVHIDATKLFMFLWRFI